MFTMRRKLEMGLTEYSLDDSFLALLLLLSSSSRSAALTKYGIIWSNNELIRLKKVYTNPSFYPMMLLF